MISLNITSITDEIFALTALREAVSGSMPSQRPPVLTPDRLPALRVMVRMAFASLTVRLGEYISESSIDADNPTPDRPYDDKTPMLLTLTLADGMESRLSAGKVLTLKRYLEHLVALDVLRSVYLPIDEAIARGHEADSAAVVDSVVSLLSSIPDPIVRSPSRW